MITEWQPVMPNDTLKLKSRTIYEFLRGDHTTFLVVGRGPDEQAKLHHFIKNEPDDVVAYREFDTRPAQSYAVASKK